MAREIGFGVLGLGMGMHHCTAVEQARGARLVAACDLDEERLHGAVKKHGCKGYVSYAEMLRDPEIDAVCIVTESGLHLKHGAMAAKAGKHMLVEKPADITPAKIAKLKQAVAAAGVKAGCVFQSRTMPVNIRLRQAIQKGKLGKLIGAHAHMPWYRAQSYYEGAHGTWKGTWKLDGGGSLMNQGIHTVDLVQWLAGPVHSVCGFSGVFSHDIEAEDQTVAILRFENGAFGTLFTTTCAVPDKGQRIYIYGEKGSFSKADALEFFEAGTPKEREQMMAWYGGAKKKGKSVASDPMAVGADGHTVLIEDLVKAIRTNREPMITLDSATHAVEIACAIFRSSRLGRVVKISEMRK